MFVSLSELFKVQNKGLTVSNGVSNLKIYAEADKISFDQPLYGVEFSLQNAVQLQWVDERGYVLLDTLNYIGVLNLLELLTCNLLI